jgi:predicted ATPase
MQKIIINNFGPVEAAEIEIPKIVVLIGKQASGKSTVAKLIYFFQTLIEDAYLAKSDIKSSYSDLTIRDIFNREIDIVTEGSLKNPYFIKEIEETKELIYGQ